jgi:hypothetical protein
MTNLNDDYSGIEIHAEESSSYVPAPAGTHVARCVTFIQLGTQKQEFNGIPGKDRMKIVLGWELPEELQVFDEAKGEQPFYITNTYSLVLGEKSTFKLHMESWTKGKINREFNPLTMLGEPCQLVIEHKPKSTDVTKITAKVTGVAAMTKNQICPEQVNPKKVLLFARWNQELFDKQPDWIRKAIEASPEYKALGTPGDKQGVFQKKIPPVIEGLNSDGLPF